MAKAYLSAKSPELVTRTWAEVMEHYTASGVESTRSAQRHGFPQPPFLMLAIPGLMDTEAGICWPCSEHKRAGNSTHHYLRRLHNYALHLGWLLTPVMAEAAWPEVRKQEIHGYHRRGTSPDSGKGSRIWRRKLYYEMLWETGGSQARHCQLALGPD